MIVMYTWRRGSRLLFEKTRRQEIPLADLVRMLEKKPPLRVPGTAVFLTSHAGVRAHRAHAQPQALQGAARAQCHPHHRTRPTRHASTHERAGPHRSAWERRFTRVTLRFGFMETPNVPRALAIARKHRLAHSTSCPHRSSCRDARSSRPPIPACRAGRITFSSCSRGSPTTPPTIFQIPDRASRGGGHAGDDLSASRQQNRSIALLIPGP